jgi:PPK2 family polyphosphate:nucleotide phosphotransferase
MAEPALRQLLGVKPGPVDVTRIDTRSTPGVRSREKDVEATRQAIGRELGDLQERLFAQSTEGARARLLLVLQGMDCSGKDGAIKKGMRGTNPKWLHVASFKAPTEEERRHHFLWRIRKEVPEPGILGVFDRSHYEDVLVARVRNLAPENVWRPRYEEINAFERRLHQDGVTIVKVMLHIGKEYQRERQLRRLERPDKRWKFNEGDLDDREYWDEYMEAYSEAIERCNTPWAPWYVVPGDRKWYRTWAVSRLVLETLRALDPKYPDRPELDIPALKERLLAS